MAPNVPATDVDGAPPRGRRSRLVALAVDYLRGHRQAHARDLARAARAAGIVANVRQVRAEIERYVAKGRVFLRGPDPDVYLLRADPMRGERSMRRIGGLQAGSLVVLLEGRHVFLATRSRDGAIAVSYVGDGHRWLGRLARVVEPWEGYGGHDGNRRVGAAATA